MHLHGFLPSSTIYIDNLMQMSQIPPPGSPGAEEATFQVALYKVITKQQEHNSPMLFLLQKDRYHLTQLISTISAPRVIEAAFKGRTDCYIAKALQRVCVLPIF